MDTVKNDISKRIYDFLHTLGISHTDRVKEHSYWQACRQEIRDAGGNPEAVLSCADPMGITVVDMYFMTESIACTFLAADVPRLYQVLESFETRNIIPESAGHITEIGGGPGIVSLWLALKHPEKRFTVYDHAQNPLSLGKKWADRLRLTNIDYIKASYETLAVKGVKNSADLVLGLSVLDLQITTDKMPLSIARASVLKTHKSVKALNHFSKACATLLKPSGTLYFSQGAFNHLGLFSLFDSLRKAGMGIDWQSTGSKGEGEGPGFSFKEIHIFASPSHPTIFTSAMEETQTFLYGAKNSDLSRKLVLGHSDFETYLGLLSTGTKLADIRIQREEQNRERYSIYVNSGMLGFFSSNSSGSRSGFVHSAAVFIPACHRLMDVIARYKTQNIRITHEFWHSFFL